MSNTPASDCNTRSYQVQKNPSATNMRGKKSLHQIEAETTRPRLISSPIILALGKFILRVKRRHDFIATKLPSIHTDSGP